VLAPVVLVALLVVYQEKGRPTTYSTQIQASVVREPDPPPADVYTYDGYYNYLSSEFAIDDLVEAVHGNVFADAVAQRATANGTSMNGGEVQGALAVSRQHRILSVNVSSSDAARAAAIAQATVDELNANAFTYISVTPANGSALVQIIQEPGTPGQNTSRERLLMGMELVAALGIGVLLAYFVNYLDDRLFDADAVTDALRLPHLANVPAERR